MAFGVIGGVVCFFVVFFWADSIYDYWCEIKNTHVLALDIATYPKNFQAVSFGYL